MAFMKNFVWGTATSSFQIEGAAGEDGKGLSIWDTFCQEEGRTFDNHNGDTACDHYHRYPEDVAIMKEMGIKAYRFSLSWPRIFPDGIGEVNEAGIDFYSRLVDELLKNDIVPYITLFHWDYPNALHEKGAWLNPDSPKWFAEYAKVVVERFGDRVKHFMTFNEPQCVVGCAFEQTIHAPGFHLPDRERLLMVHHILLAHGMAVKVIRECGHRDIQVGFAPTGLMHFPADGKAENIEAARKAIFSVPEAPDNWGFSVSWWSDPVFFGAYPEDGLERFREVMPRIGQDDMKIISAPIDFYGQNIYNGAPIESDGQGGFRRCKRKAGYPMTNIHWPVTPESLYWGPRFLYERYQTPIYITENGMSAHDVVSLDGKVHDPNRIDFLNRYLLQLRKASEDGVDIRGYFEWSLMDNFEWSNGYSQRFGLVYVDYQTQQRIWKDSAYWYQNVIHTNGECL